MEKDMRLIKALGKREATSGVKFLHHLFANPIVSSSNVAQATGFTRSGAMKLIERFIDLGILHQLDETARYGKTYSYKSYIDIFSE